MIAPSLNLSMRIIGFNRIHYPGVVAHPDPDQSRDIALFIGDLLVRCLKSPDLDPFDKKRAACSLASTLLFSYLEGQLNLNTFRRAFGNYRGPLQYSSSYHNISFISLLALECPQLLLLPVWDLNYRYEWDYNHEGVSLLIKSCSIGRFFSERLEKILRCVEESGRLDILSNLWRKILFNFTTFEDLADCVRPHLLSLALQHQKTMWLHIFCEALPTLGDRFASPQALPLQRFLESLPEELLDFSKPDDRGQSPLHLFFRSEICILDPEALETFLRFALDHCKRKLGRMREMLRGFTLLHTVCEYATDPEKLEISIRLLLEAGHPTNCRDSFKRTPLQHAKHRKNKTAIRILNGA